MLLQDFTGVPAVVDLAAMRAAMADLGGDPQRINPLIPVELVIDHSVQVDDFATRFSIERNSELEFSRNRERYAFLRWGQGAFANFKAVPPNTGICHQVNLEFLARVVEERDGQAFPDTVVGTDSHTTMVNGLGVLGWGVGGIEAEAAMLGEAISMLVPQVVGFRLHGALPEGATATDLVLTVTQILRQTGVVGKFVEYFGHGLAGLPLADRATIGNMSPGVRRHVRVLPGRRRDAPLSASHRPQRRAGRARRGVLQGERALARPRRAADLLAGRRARPLHRRAVARRAAAPAGPDPAARGAQRASRRRCRRSASARATAASTRRSRSRWTRATPPAADGDRRARPRVELTIDGETVEIDHGAVVIAAITSCTNTSNPAVMIGAGLLAKKAVERGLTRRPWVKTSLAPGSKVVTEYYEKAGLTPYLEALGFHTVGYGCTTCIGNSGPLPEAVSQAVAEGDLVACAVLSGNRNFEARIHPEVKANYLASPPLVVAYALAGRMDVDITTEPLGHDPDGSARATSPTSGRRRPRCRRRSRRAIGRDMFLDDVRERLRRRGRVARAAGADRRAVRLGGDVDLRAPAAVLRRHGARSRARSTTSPAHAASSRSATRSRPTTSPPPARSSPTRPAGRVPRRARRRARATSTPTDRAGGTTR